MIYWFEICGTISIRQVKADEINILSCVSFTNVVTSGSDRYWGAHEAQTLDKRENASEVK